MKISSLPSFLRTACVLCAFALTLGSTASADTVRRWAYTVTKPAGSLGEGGLQLKTDGAGGVAAIYDINNGDGTYRRRLLWLNERGQVLAHLELGNNSELGEAFPKRVFVAQDYKVIDAAGTLADALRIVSRDGRSELFTGQLDNGSFGQNPTFYTSRPFDSDGFFSFEFIANPKDPNSALLQIARYSVR